MTPGTRDEASLAIPINEIRAHFPALVRREGAHPVAYFDGPGGTQVPLTVADAVRSYLLEHNANTHWAYPTSNETDTLLAEARDVFSDFLRCEPEDISFGNNMTTITFHIARALARGWTSGDEIVVTELDHHANVAPWQAVAREHGLVLRTVRLDPKTFRTDVDDLAAKLGPRTKLLAIGAASNALGTVTDVKRACAMAHEQGALTYVDAVHYAPHNLVDVGAIGCDFLVCSAYKFYGPHVGVLFAKHDLANALDVPRLEPAPSEAPERLETGTLNHEGIVGAAEAVMYLGTLARGGASRRERLSRAFTAFHARGEALLAQLWEGLRAIESVTLYGPEPGTPRTPTVSFTLRGHSTEDVARHLAKRGVYVSHGDFYAATVATRLGRGEDGFVRAGTACYTTADEVQRLVDGVRELARQ